MKELSYAIVTPSFRLDFQRCQFLVESVARWVEPHVKHYLIIDRRDCPCSGRWNRAHRIDRGRRDHPCLADAHPRIQALLVQSADAAGEELDFATDRQAIGTAAVADDVLMYADSDMFFVAPFDPRSFERDGQVTLLFEAGQRGLIPSNDHWQAVAAKLLGSASRTGLGHQLRGQGQSGGGAQNALKALQRVNEVQGKSWQVQSRRWQASPNTFSTASIATVCSVRIPGTGTKVSITR